jgi:hypothetical protein
MDSFWNNKREKERKRERALNRMIKNKLNWSSFFKLKILAKDL